MTSLRVIGRHEVPPRAARTPAAPALARSGLLALTTVVGLALTCLLIWWLGNADTREIRALPDAQRVPLYHRTLDNLRTICDPAAPRSLRDFCHKEADLVLRFRECDSDASCQELARRHLPQPVR